ncbi:hypothetical protein AP75_13445 [Kaistella haifensis DSM 19056]|uniref:WG repeat-containing protein n=1 Tax=Kaistella haifensis DSM 19056 TaxID=1450526 RepID=A0A246B6K9_9FLAO|nr:WG repeat-containing protein [Kaistella haifensis]OWK97015.1 hypothetical protein AP75_13445 [Kaistella haifensis DSM 19056]
MNRLQPKDVTEVFTFYRDENNGKEPTEWEHVTIFDKQGYGIISVDGYSGVIDRNGNIIIPLEYNNLIDFEELESKIILGNKGELWGFINWKNEIIIPFEYSYASVFQDGEAKVCKDEKYYIINEHNLIIKEIDGLDEIL